MSLPDEELRSVRSTWDFLLSLGNSYGPWKRVPSEVRREARFLSKHFPLGGELRSLVEYAEKSDEALVKCAEEVENESGIKGAASETLREIGYIHLCHRLKCQ